MLAFFFSGSENIFGHRIAYRFIFAATERNKRFSREAIRPFFELLGERCRQIEAVAMDMSCTTNKQSMDYGRRGEPDGGCRSLAAPVSL